MAHTHPVIDDDKEFIIDPVSRVISHPAENQPILIQHDHNSERMTFKIPLSIDGHDLTKCNLIRVHFINISATDIAETCASLYEVDDLKADTEDPTQAVFSWLIAQEATMYVGTLSFLVEFACVDTSTKIIDYSWHTGIYDGIIISNGMDNSEAVIGNRYDVLDTWLQQFKNELMKSANDASSIVKAASVKAQEDIDAYADEVKENLAVDVLTARGYLTDDIVGNSTKKVVSQYGVNQAINDVKASVDTIDDRLTKILNVSADKVYRIEGVFSDTITLGDHNKSNAYVDVGVCIIGPAVRLEFGVNGEYMLDDTIDDQLPYGIKPHEPIAICVSSSSVEVQDNVYEYDNTYLTIDTDGNVSYSVVRETDQNGETEFPAVVRFMCHTEKSEYIGGLAELLDVSIPASSHTTYVKGVTGEEPEYSSAGEAVRAQIQTLWDYLDHYHISINSHLDQAKWNIEDIEEHVESLNDTTNDRIDKNSKRLTNIERSLNPESFEIDDTVAYIKDVPEDVLPRALINKVGGISRKCTNLIPYPYYDFSNDSFNISGVTGIIEKQVIRISGTCTSVFERRLNNVELIVGNTYTIYANQSSEYTRVYLRKNGELYRSIGKGNDPFSFTVNSGETYSVYILVLNGYTYSNDTIAVMLNEGSTALPYEPFFSGLRETKVTEVKSVGRNIWDEEWEHGYLDRGIPVDSSNNIRSKNFIPVKASTRYYGRISDDSNGMSILFYSKERIYLSSVSIKNDVFTTPSDCYFIKLYTYGTTGSYGKSYSNDVCINEFDESINGIYEPYAGHTFQIPAAVQALPGYGIGISKTCNNYIEWNPDEGTAKLHKCVGVVDMGTLDWYYLTGGATRFQAKIPSDAKPSTNDAITSNIRCSKYTEGSANAVYAGTAGICIAETNVWVHDTDYTDAATFKSAMQGVMLVYELATPDIVDISDKITPDNIIDVISGGTITAVNRHGDPAFVEMVYQHEEV